MRKYIFTIILILSYSVIIAQKPLKSTQFFNFIGYAEIDIKSYKTIYTVPKDSCLIITDLLIEGFYSTSGLYSNKKLMIKLNNKSWFHTGTGILFNSGAQLMLYSEAVVSTNSSWHIIGYLQKQE